MTLLALTCRALLSFTIALAPMVCCCTSTVIAKASKSMILRSDAEASASEGSSHRSPCHRPSAPGSSHAPPPIPKQNHAPGDCPDCEGTNLTIENSPTQLVVVSTPIFPDSASFIGSVQMGLGLDPASPSDGAVSKPLDDFGGDSLRALSRLLTI